MSEDFLDDRMENWERRALEGDYTAMPATFGWRGSARFAHFLNGYEEAGGFDRLSQIHRPMAEAQHETARWDGSAKDLWLCLFFEHRAARHCGSEAEGPELRGLNSLCVALRSALQGLSGVEARALASLTRPE